MKLKKRLPGIRANGEGRERETKFLHRGISCVDGEKARHTTMMIKFLMESGARVSYTTVSQLAGSGDNELKPGDWGIGEILG